MKPYILAVISVCGTFGLFFLVWAFIRGFLKLQQWKSQERKLTLKADLSRLQTARWGDELSCNDTCCLCDGDYRYNEEFVILNCNHGGHMLCINDHIKRSRLYCPACQAGIVPNYRRYKEQDLEESSDSNESTPLMKTTYLQKLGVGQQGRLRLPSDAEVVPGPSRNVRVAASAKSSPGSVLSKLGMSLAKSLSPRKSVGQSSSSGPGIEAMIAQHEVPIQIEGGSPSSGSSEPPNPAVPTQPIPINISAQAALEASYERRQQRVAGSLASSLPKPVGIQEHFLNPNPGPSRNSVN